MSTYLNRPLFHSKGPVGIASPVHKCHLRQVILYKIQTLLVRMAQQLKIHLKVP